MNERSARGAHWETFASNHLRAQGLEILARGYRCRLGELDIVCLDGETLVIVEVRARSTGARTTALESISRAKRQRIVNAARHFLMRHPQWFHSRLRFDVVAVDAVDTDEPTLNWVRNAFDGA